MAHQLSQDQLVRAVLDMDRHYVAILYGAGASRTSGILLAREIVHDLCLDSYCDALEIGAKGREHVRAREVRQWLQVQDWYASAKEHGESDYSAVFRRFKPTADHQIAYIKRLVRDAKPAPAYDGLAHLVHDGVFDLALTTNFDPLLENRYKAIFPVDVLNTLRVAHDFHFATADSARRQLAYLHGSLDGYSISNLDEDTKLLQPDTEAALGRMLDGYALVVVGYSGQDASVMGLLDHLAAARPSSFRRGTVYWCHLPGDEPGPRASAFLQKVAQGFTVEVFGFDKLIEALCKKAGLAAGIFDVASPPVELVPRGRVLPDRAVLNATPAERLPEFLPRFRTKLQGDDDLRPFRDRYAYWQARVKDGYLWLLGNPDELPEKLRKSCSLEPEQRPLKDADRETWNMFADLSNRALRWWLHEKLGLFVHGDRAERYYFPKPKHADVRHYNYRSRKRRASRQVVWLEFERGSADDRRRYYCHEAVRPRIMQFQGEPVLRLSPTRLFTIEGDEVWTGKSAGASVGRATRRMWNAEYDSLVRMWLEMFASGGERVIIPFSADARQERFRLEFSAFPFQAIRIPG